MFTQANDGMAASVARSILSVQELGSTLTKPFRDAYTILQMFISGVNETALAASARRVTSSSSTQLLIRPA